MRPIRGRWIIIVTFDIHHKYSSLCNFVALW